MSGQCGCRCPAVAGEGEQQHCTRCGFWTAAALQVNRERHEREAIERQEAKVREAERRAARAKTISERPE